MASPGPGYNPQESLLSGGTAPIVAVQGGGGLGEPPPGYNENQSLLQGGTATIEATRGGAVTFAKDVTVRQEGEKNTSIALKGTLQKYRIDQYKVPEGTGTQNRERYEKILYRKYVQRHGITEELINLDEGKTSKNTSRPLFDVCKVKAPPILFQTMPRKIHVIDASDVKLWVIPPLNGKLSHLAGILKVIGVGTDSKLKPNEYLIFQAPFFAAGTPRDNADYQLLFTIFLELKDANENRVFILNHLSDRTVKYGCAIAKSLHSDPTKKRLPVFFEPDVLVFLKQKILFRSDALPITKEGWKVSTLLEKMKKGSYPTPLLLRPDSSKGTERIDGFFEFVGGSAEETSLPGGPAATKGCPGYECPEFIKSVKMDSKSLVSPLALRDPSLYLVWSTDSRLPYLKKKAEGEEKKEVEANEEEEEEEEEEDEVTQTKTETETENPAKKPRTETLEEEDTNVKESEDCIEGTSTDKNTPTVSFNLTGVKLEVREADEKAKAEWKQGVFTPSEAKLLCLLHLSPSLLQELFKDEKWNEVSDFLESMSESKCYEDSTLLLQRECDKARSFLRTIYMDRFVTLLDIYTGKTMVKASKKTSEALTELMAKFRDVSLQKNALSLKLDQLHEITRGLADKLKLSENKPKNQDEFNKALKVYQKLMRKQNSGQILDDGDKNELKQAEAIINKFEKKYSNNSSNSSILQNLTVKLKDLTLS